MTIKATCTKNPEHKTFITTAHVVETWVVEEDGTFVESIEAIEVVHRPHPENLWTCAECNAEAKVTLFAVPSSSTQQERRATSHD